MNSALDDVEIFYLDDMEDEILITKTEIRRQNLKLNIHYYLDEAAMLASLDQRLTSATPLPGLIVSDLNMPGEGGIGLMRRLRADRAYQNVTIGICTSSENPADRRAALDAGADFVAPKPFDGRTLSRICETNGRFQLIETGSGDVCFHRSD